MTPDTMNARIERHDVSPQDMPSAMRFADDAPSRSLTRADCEAILHTVQQTIRGHGKTRISIESRWTGDVRWARNRTHVVSDRRNTQVTVFRELGETVRVSLNQTDPESVATAVRRAETLVRDGLHEGGILDDVYAALPQPSTAIWSDTTFDQPLATRSAAVDRLTTAAAQAGMLSAGYLNVASRTIATVDLRRSSQLFYARQTFAQCSLTVRAPDGMGSGWAGVSSYDWNRVDSDRLGATALDKCLRSRNPVVIEPGRYTAILEPQAVYDLMRPMLGFLRGMEEDRIGRDVFFSHPGKVSIGEWSRPVDFSKIGERIIDTRITVSHDPADPELGVVPFADVNDVYSPVTWIKDGVLNALQYDRRTGRGGYHDDRGYLYSGSFRMSGGQTTMQEMIATTKRGVIVTRFSGLRQLNGPLLCTGLTRDGFWLVENGVITHPIKNFRFTESPLFAFNQVEQLGTPVPIFNPESPAIVPPVKVRDFSFTSLIDAI